MTLNLSEKIPKLLRPVIRFCYRRGCKIQQLVEFLKISLIEIAEEELEAKDQEVNISRLSISTGLHRRDVMRLWRDEEAPKAEATLLMKILGLWSSGKRFRTAEGKPKVLSFEGRESEFASLVESVSKDINSYTVLFELERAGLVERTSQGLKLKKTVFTPGKGDVERGFQLLSSDLNDIVSAVEENVFRSERVPHLHIKTQYDKIPVSKLPEIREKILDEGVSFHKRMSEYLSKYDRDINPSKSDEACGRISLGSFSYSEAETENSSVEVTPKSPKKKGERR